MFQFYNSYHIAQVWQKSPSAILSLMKMSRKCATDMARPTLSGSPHCPPSRVVLEALTTPTRVQLETVDVCRCIYVSM